MTGQRGFTEDQFDPAHDFDYDGPTTKTLVIASTPRSGSHMLGHVLHETGLFGHPLEYVHASNQARWRQVHGTSGTEDTMRAIMGARTSPGGVFSVKLHYSHLREFGGLSALRGVFPDPHFVLLRRRDTVKQAVSFTVANQSRMWIDDTADPGSLEYDFTGIQMSLADVMRQTANWRFDLLREGAPLLELDSEDVLADVPGAVRRIAGFLDVDVPDERVPDAPVTRKQSSPLNAQWAERFRADAAQRPSSGLPARPPLRRVVRKRITQLRRRIGR